MKIVRIVMISRLFNLMLVLFGLILLSIMCVSGIMLFSGV